jgi:hypothetical protein
MSLVTMEVDHSPGDTESLKSVSSPGLKVMHLDSLRFSYHRSVCYAVILYCKRIAELPFQNKFVQYLTILFAGRSIHGRGLQNFCRFARHLGSHLRVHAQLTKPASLFAATIRSVFARSGRPE